MDQNPKKGGEGSKISCAETILTGVADFQRYHQGRRTAVEQRGNKRVEGNGIFKKKKNRNQLCLFLHSNNVDLNK